MGAEVKQAVLFGAMPGEDWAFLKDYLEERFLVICADGGMKNARRAGLEPDLLVGDWDSGGAPLEGVPTVSLPVEKDMTDLQAAVDLALGRGCDRLLLCGCTGGRMDHTASNLVLLEWIADRGAEALILDSGNEVRFHPGGTLLLPNVPAYRYLSIIPLDRTIEGVTLRGVKYPLTDALLTRGDTLSVSNEPVGEVSEISIASGRVLVVRSERLSTGPL